MKSVLGEFISGVPICPNKGPQSDLEAPFSPRPGPLREILPGGTKTYTGPQGRNQLFISGGGAIFMIFHSMTSSCLFKRGTTFSQTVTDMFLSQHLKMRTY